MINTAPPFRDGSSGFSSSLGGSSTSSDDAMSIQFLEDDRRASAEIQEIFNSRINPTIYRPNDLWGLSIVETPPKTPTINWEKLEPSTSKTLEKNYSLFYLPEKILVEDKETRFTLKTFKKVLGSSHDSFDEDVLEKFGNTRASGWKLMRHEGMNTLNFDHSKNDFFHTFRRPNVLEAVSFFALGAASLTASTLCAERFNETSSVTVEYYDDDMKTLSVSKGTDDAMSTICLLRDCI